MGTLKTSKAHSLAANQGIKYSKAPNISTRKQKKDKEKKSKFVDESSHSKVENPKSEKVKCTYCNKPGHVCMKK